uniref:Variant surface glycoprotein 1125.1706 n=1 Tax=Trypanosoma brucei TaxID=5691 RepID=A0A1J0R7K9_9TRYP|nr:variant surface glycoprotein 1125.1706 [Trypanosoma brucei]
MWLILALLTLGGARVERGAEKNVNGVEFNLFCHIANMLNGEKIKDVKTDGLDSQAQAAWTEVKNIFTVTSNESYYNEVPTPTTTPGAEDGSAKAARIAKWVQARQEMEKTKLAGEPNKKKYTRQKRDKMPKGTQKKLNTPFKLASQAESEVQGVDRQLATNAEEIRAAARSAILGGNRQGSQTKPTVDDDAFGGNYATGCKGQAGTGKNLANDIVCICCTDSGNDKTTLQMCTSIDERAAYSAPYNSAANAKTVFTALLTVCGKTSSKPELTTGNIEASIAAFTAALGRNTKGSATNEGAYVFGNGEDSGDECNGGAASGQSRVSYHGLITACTGTELGTAIVWIRQLQIVWTKLKTRRQLLQKRERQQTRLISLAVKMQELYQEALHGELPITTEAQNKPQPTPDSDKQEACEKVTNKTACEAKCCKWSGTEETIVK